MTDGKSAKKKPQLTLKSILSGREPDTRGGETLTRVKAGASAVKKRKRVVKSQPARGSAVNELGPGEPCEASDAFKCLECGTYVPHGVERCPHCHVLYVECVSDKEPKKQAHSEVVVGAEGKTDQRLEVDGHNARVVHLSTESGKMSMMERSGYNFSSKTECPRCGSVIEFDVDACPICGTELGNTGGDLFSIFSDMDIDSGCSGEINCPLCGERTVPKDGNCQVCGEKVHADDPEDRVVKVQLLISGKKVVFVHLDVGAGELNYLQSLEQGHGYEQVSVMLGDATPDLADGMGEVKPS